MCSKCGAEKPRTEFNKNASKADGLADECKACNRARCAAYHAANREKRRAYFAAYYAANREKERARVATYYAKNREKRRAYLAAYTAERRATPEGRARRLIADARRNAKLRGHPPPEITVEDILPAVKRGVCQVTGLPFVWHSGGKRHPLAPSLDRPDSSRPYTRDNWRIVCWAVNAGCFTWGLDTYLAIAARALGVQGPPLPSRYLEPRECSTGTGNVRPKSPVKEMQHDEDRVLEN